MLLSSYTCTSRRTPIITSGLQLNLQLNLQGGLLHTVSRGQISLLDCELVAV